MDRSLRFRLLLFIALPAALALLALDRYAAYVHVPAADSTQVVLYTTDWCGYCARLRRDLAQSNIPYVEHDVEKSLQGQLGYWALRGTGVPVAAIGPTVVHGYSVERMTTAMQTIGRTYVSADDALKKLKPLSDLP
jgi:mycoredoxin